MFPTKKQHFINQCFNTLYYIAKENVANLPQEMEEIFPTLMAANPEKGLTILNFFCMQDWDSRDFWNIVLLLVKNFRVFVSSNVGVKFVKYMEYILEIDEQFCQTFINHHLKYHVLASLSLGIRDEVIGNLYQLLTLISLKSKELPPLEDDDDDEDNEDNEVKDELLAKHLKIESIQKDVISYLITCDIPLGVKTIKSLSKIGLKRSGYAILNFALSDADHSSLTESLSWLESKEISPQIKIRIFLAILLDKSTRPSLSMNPQVLNFLCILIQTNNKEIFKMLSTCVRRLLNKDSLGNFQNCHFFQKYWAAVMAMNDSSVVDASIMSVDKLVNTGYISDLNDIIPTLKHVINSYQESADQAVQILAKCSAYPECKEALMKYRHYFARLKQAKNFDDECNLFESNIH